MHVRAGDEPVGLSPQLHYSAASLLTGPCAWTSRADRLRANIGAGRATAIEALIYFLYLAVLVFPAWLCASMRYWHAWTVYALVTILLLIPVSVVSFQCFRATICDLGMGLAMLVTGSWPLAWLFGSLLGLLFRFLNKLPKSN
jgi:hypothetical protein